MTFTDSNAHLDNKPQLPKILELLSTPLRIQREGRAISKKEEDTKRSEGQGDGTSKYEKEIHIKSEKA